MNCSFEIDDYNVNGPDFFQERISKARKKYRCCECGGDIKPGDPYERVSGKWDGEVSNIRTCILCSRIRKDLCRSWTYGELREVIREELGFDYVTSECYGVDDVEP